MYLRKLLKRKLLGLCSLERAIARQRSRVLQLREGDASTAFFHQQACHRQRRNVISTLQHGSEVATGQDEIGEAVDTYYSGLFEETVPREFTIQLDALRLPTLELSHLEEQFTEEEVERVIKGMPLDKAPGPDGFTGRFFAVCWPIIKGDIMRAMEAFFRGDMRGLPAINKAIITLVPKMDGAVDIKDFRPISLVHGAVKIFEKTLSARLAPELPRLVGSHQSAFIKGRSIDRHPLRA